MTVDYSWKLDALNVGFGQTILVSNINCTFQLGDMVAVTGGNGVGKSCLLKTMAGLNPALSGFIHAPAGFGHHKLGIVPQISEISPRFRVSLQEMVALGLAQTKHVHQQERVSEALDVAGLNAAKSRQAWQHSSGGERQRALIARALVRRPEVLLLDEVTSHLDETGITSLMSYLQALCADAQMLVVAVMHDEELVAKYFPRRMHILDGCADLSGW